MWVKSNGNLFNLEDISAITICPFHGSMHPDAKTRYTIEIVYNSGYKTWNSIFYETQEEAEKVVECLFNHIGKGIEKYVELEGEE